jgi:beta-galactosidase/beta-glucuronidase
MNPTFGFRWFAPEGIGSNAMFRINGKRIVLRSAISWGWWAPNGLFPTDEMARKEVLAAQSLGLNCLQFHRNIGHPNVLDEQDRLGLLRYEEPGTGSAVFPKGISDIRMAATDQTGLGGEPVTFDQKYEVEKILRMVRRDRSHPSLVVYGRSHEAQVGVGACVIKCGKGMVVLPSLPGLRDALVSAKASITQPVAQRILGNALRPVLPARRVAE